MLILELFVNPKITSSSDAWLSMLSLFRGQCIVPKFDYCYKNLLPPKNDYCYKFYVTPWRPHLLHFHVFFALVKFGTRACLNACDKYPKQV